MDRRSLIAIGICFAIFMAWQKLYLEPRFPTGKGATTQTTTAPSEVGATTPEAKPAKLAPPSTNAIATQSITLERPAGKVFISSENAWLSNWEISEYKLGPKNERRPTELSSVTHRSQQLELAFDATELGYFTSARGQLRSTADGGALWSFEDANLKVERQLSPPADPSDPWLELSVRADFKKATPKFAFISIVAESPKDDPEAHDRQLAFWANNDIERENLQEIPAILESAGPTRWISASSRYFLFGLVAPEGHEPRGLVQALAGSSGRISFSYPLSGNHWEARAKVFFVPKRLETLRQIVPSLDHSVDLGWFTVFAYPLLKLLKWFYSVFHNYGFAIIALTLLVRMAVYPLAYKSAKSMREMARLQPQLQRLRERHKDDKEALNREMLTVMRTHGYNPMAGCLPLLVQMPIFFALYRVLYSAIELYQAPFGLWIHDLSARDPFYVTPILMTGVMYLQQRLTPITTADPAQAKMMQWMPVIFGLFMLTLPAGLTLYMFTSTLVGIVQQVILNKKLGLIPTAAGTATAKPDIVTTGRPVKG